METQTQRKPGRPSAGPRVEITARVRPELHGALRALAKARGVTVTEILTCAIEKELGVPAATEASRSKSMSQVA